MASSFVTKLTCVMLLCMVAGAPFAQAAITCGQVVSSLTPCIGYLTSGAPLPPACCAGVQSLNSAAKTTPDRQAACNCLKAANANIKGINFGLAAGLPGKCGVNIPYKISPSTNCATVK